MLASLRNKATHVALVCCVASALAAQSPVRVLPTYSTFNSGGPVPMSIDSIADLDGDGYRDILVGLPSRDRLVVLSGRSGAGLYSLNGPALTSFGAKVAAIGDVDGDGLEEIAVGAPAQAGNGAVQIYSTGGGVLTLLSTVLPTTASASLSAFGSSITRLGNLAGNGVEEIAIGAPKFSAVGGPVNCGIVEIINLALPSPPPVVPWSFVTAVRGATAADEFGNSLARLGDLNGDGLSELAIGAPREFVANQPGLVTVLSGASLAAPGAAVALANLASPNLQDDFGWSVANAGDIDGDGLDDLVVGAPSELSAAQYSLALVYVYPGKRIGVAAGGPVAPAYTVKPLNAAPLRAFGWSVSGTADVDGDGVRDLMIGAPTISHAPLGAGYVMVASGRTGLPLQVLGALNASSKFGTDVSELDTGRLSRMVVDESTGTLHVY